MNGKQYDCQYRRVQYRILNSKKHFQQLLVDRKNMVSPQKNTRNTRAHSNIKFMKKFIYEDQSYMPRLQELFHCLTSVFGEGSVYCIQV